MSFEHIGKKFQVSQLATPQVILLVVDDIDRRGMTTGMKMVLSQWAGSVGIWRKVKKDLDRLDMVLDIINKEADAKNSRRARRLPSR